MPSTKPQSTKSVRIVLKQLHPFLIAVIGFILAMVALLFICPLNVDIYKQLRGSLFTGLFAVSGFLLSAKSLVILNLKKEIYGEEWYLNRIHQHDWSRTPIEKKQKSSSRENCSATSNVYRPLAQVGKLLTVNIILALVASFSQITLGLFELRLTVAICLSMAIATGILLGYSVWLMGLNFEIMYNEWEQIAQEKLDKKWCDSMNDFHQSEVQPNASSMKPTKTVGPNDELP